MDTMKERLTAVDYLVKHTQRVTVGAIVAMKDFAAQEVEAAIAETKKQRDELMEALRDIINVDKHSHLTSTNASLMRERAEIAITNAQEK
jgi:hypothetical protein